MSMRKELHIPEDDLIQYALGTLSDIQLNNLTAHVSMCGVCRAELNRTQVALASYSATMPLEELPHGARDRFVARLETADAPQTRFTALRRRSPLVDKLISFKEWLESPLPIRVFAGVLAACLVYMVFDDVSHIREIHQLLNQSARFQAEAAKFSEIESFLRGSDAMQVSLHEKPQVTRAPEGHAVYSASSGKLVFIAQNMPTPPVGKAYELWILPATGGKPIPAGVFTPDVQGNGAIVFPTLAETAPASGFGVTIEDASGAQTPTLPIILSGQ